MTQIKPLWWSVFLVVLGTLYLIPESIFNSQIVSLLGIGTPDADDLEHLELFGRTVSGIGVTLLLADFLKAKWVSSMPRAIFSFSLLTLIVWPTVFYGQKYLLETYIIEPSTAEDRQQAVYSAALRDALAMDAIKISSVDYNTRYLDSPENLTFLALFGGLAYADEGLANSLEDSKSKIIEAFIRKKAYGDFKNHYTEYSKLYGTLATKYNTYADGSRKYNDALLNMSAKEAKYWVETEQQINSGYQSYLDAKKSHIARASARAQKYGPKIYDYFEDVTRCRTNYTKSSQSERLNKCLEKRQIKYRSDILDAGIGYIDPNYWLIPIQISTGKNILTSVVGGLLTGGIYNGLQLASALSGGDGGVADVRYEYTSSPDHYQLKFLQHPKYEALFVKETGYSSDVKSLAEFRGSDKTLENVKAKLKSKGLNLPINWTLNDRLSFSNAIKSKIQYDAKQAWVKETRSRGYNIEPNLSWVQFQLHPDIQSEIAKSMKDNYVENIRADWNERSFKNNVIDVIIVRRAQEYLKKINSSLAEFENGGEYEEYGKQALRSVIVPPISMFLSLFLICLTIIKLPGKYYSLFRSENISNKNVWVSIAPKIAMPLLILVLPVLLVSNNYTKNKNSTVNYFLKTVEEGTSPLASYAIRWTLHAQPLLHPLGSVFERVTGAYEGFNRYKSVLHSIDIDTKHKKKVKKTNLNKIIITTDNPRINAFIREGKDKDLSRYLHSVKSGVLYVDADKGSKVQIMNIKPKYKDGIILPIGAYDIKLTRSSGSVSRSWVNLNAEVKVVKGGDIR